MVVVVLKEQKSELSICFIGERILANQKLDNLLQEELEIYLGKKDIEKLLFELGTRVGNVVVYKIDNGYLVKNYSKIVEKEIVDKNGWIFSYQEEVNIEKENENIVKFFILSYVVDNIQNIPVENVNIKKVIHVNYPVVQYPKGLLFELKNNLLKLKKVENEEL